MHASFETPGVIEDWAKDKDFKFGGTRTYANDELPESSEVDFLVVLGGPQSPLRIDEYPYLQDEINLISRVIKEGKPVIGFCLGSQLIAEALGAQTQRSPEKEVGVFPIQLTQAGQSDPILKHFPTEFDVLHWHHDMPGISEDAVLLAQSAGCPHQSFRVGDRIYGFQFHMEPTKKSIQPLLKNAVDDLTPSKYTQTPEEILSSDFETMNERMKFILDSIVTITNG